MNTLTLVLWVLGSASASPLQLEYRELRKSDMVCETESCRWVADTIGRKALELLFDKKPSSLNHSLFPASKKDARFFMAQKELQARHPHLNEPLQIQIETLKPWLQGIEVENGVKRTTYGVYFYLLLYSIDMAQSKWERWTQNAYFSVSLGCTFKMIQKQNGMDLGGYSAEDAFVTGDYKRAGLKVENCRANLFDYTR